MNHSLQYKLSAWLAGVVVAVALAAGIFSFMAAFQEAYELQDDQLRQIAALVQRQHLALPESKESAPAAGSDEESWIVIQALSPAPAQPHAGAPPVVEFPPTLQDGIQTTSVHNQGWRVIVTPLANGERIAVGQRTRIRDETARDSALRTVLPLLLLVPIVIVLVSALVRQTLKPVKHLADKVRARSQGELNALNDEHLPAEIQPFVSAINTLLGRIRASMAGQRRFLADAAHELRTPLTALSLQAESLKSADLSPAAQMRLRALVGGLARSRQLLDQLLALARVQDTAAQPLQPVSLNACLRHVLEDLMPLAEAKNIDVGVVHQDECTVAATDMDLHMVLKNLIDNAIRYTPAHGKIDIALEHHAQSLVLQLQDTGPGIPVSERARVFDPFYRVLGNAQTGSGLGLSIVHTIATRLGATVELDHADPAAEQGLKVHVRFPHPAIP